MVTVHSSSKVPRPVEVRGKGVTINRRRWLAAKMSTADSTGARSSEGASPCDSGLAVWHLRFEDKRDLILRPQTEEARRQERKHLTQKRRCNTSNKYTYTSRPLRAAPRGFLASTRKQKASLSHGRLRDASNDSGCSLSPRESEEGASVSSQTHALSTSTQGLCPSVP